MVIKVFFINPPIFAKKRTIGYTEYILITLCFFMRFTYRTPGFTLIEIMIVVTMIAILAITVRPSVSKYLERGRDAGKIVDMSEIGKALRVYEIDKGSYPVGSIEGCYPQDTLVPNYLQKARVSPSGSKWDEGCGKNGLYGYGSSTYLMLLMANMENKNGGGLFRFNDRIYRKSESSRILYSSGRYQERNWVSLSECGCGRRKYFEWRSDL